MVKRLALGLGIILCLILATGSLWMTETLPAAPSDREFSAKRAMAHITVVAGEPHPMGTKANQRVGDHIAARLGEMGVSWDVQEAPVPDYFGVSDGSDFVTIRNMVARVPGSSSTGSIALVGHYDSVPSSPGANDDGSAVATLLETLRALVAGPPLLNDVIVVFTDGEEPGNFRHGARRFVGQHPWAEDIALVLNFEALGRTGPSMMFETGPGNLWILEELGQAVPRPVAFSFLSDLYRLVAKGSTDFAAFDEAGINGMNFAYSYGRTVYHTALDSVESVDERSLQHHGSNALNLARHFGDFDFSEVDTTRGEDAIYFAILGRHLVVYPASWAWPLASAAGVLLGGLVLIGLKRKEIGLVALALASLMFVFELVAIAGLLTLAWWGLDEAHLRFGTVVAPGVKAHLYFVAFLALSVVAVEIGTLVLGKGVGTTARAVAPTLCWWILAMLSSLFLPGFSTLFTWPLLASLPVLGWILWMGTSIKNTWGSVGVLAVSGIPGIVITVVPIYVSFQAFGVSSPGFSGSPSFPIIGPSIFFWVMLVGLLGPQIEFVRRSQGRRWIGLLLTVALGTLAAGGLAPGISLSTLGLGR